jgi:TolA-binding protein
MRKSPLVAGSFLALSVSGCFATKGDVRLLQEEVRAARASAARSDSIQRQTSDSLRVALANLSAVQTLAAKDAVAAQQKTSDEIKALATRVTNNDIATKEQLKALDDDVNQVREIARQNARGAAAVRAQMEQATRPPAPTLPPDSTSAAAPPTPSGPPGPATLLTNGRSLVAQGSCSTGRRSFLELLTQYPDSPDAPEALSLIAESYVACGEGGNPAKADSVYRLVTERYPKTDFASVALYKRAEALRLANKMSEAKPLYERIVCEYPKSTILAQTLSRLGGQQRPTCR